MMKCVNLYSNSMN